MAIKISSRPKREKVILCITIIIFIVSLIFNFLISPSIAKLNRLNQDINKKTSLLMRYSRLIGKGENIISLYESYKDNLRTQTNSERVVADLFKEIKDSAKQFNLNLERIRPRPTEEKKGYKEVSLEVELLGDFSSIFEFVNHFEDSSSFVRIFSLRLSPHSDKSSHLRCKITFSKIFF